MLKVVRIRPYFLKYFLSFDLLNMGTKDGFHIISNHFYDKDFLMQSYGD